MNNTSLIYFLLCAATISNAAEYMSVATLSAGPVWSINNGESQTIWLAPQTVKTYEDDSSTNTLANGEIFLGFQYPSHHLFQGQFGIAFVATGNANFSGDIWDDGSSEFNNFDYEYKVNHRHIALKGKWLADWGAWVIPWVSGSIGLGFNKSHDFENTSTIFQALANPDFSSQTEASFTYTVGVGAQASLSEHWQLGVGYEFADWGRSEFEDGPTLAHLYTNGLMFNMTYLF